MTETASILATILLMIWSFGLGVYIECTYHIGHRTVPVPDWLVYMVLGIAIGITGMRIYYDNFKEDSE